MKLTRKGRSLRKGFPTLRSVRGPRMGVPGCLPPASLRRQISHLAILTSLCAAAASSAPAQDVAWIRQFGSQVPASDWASAVDAMGNIYVVGQTDGAFSGQVNSAPSPWGHYDVFVRKYDPAGNEIWTRQFGAPVGSASATGVAVGGSGVYVAGWTDGEVDGQSLPPSPYPGVHAFVRKYDADGVVLWTRQFENVVTAQFQRVYTVATALAAGGSGVYVAGSTAGALPGQVGDGTYDAFVRRYDSDGNEVWTRQFGAAFVSSSDPYAYDFAEDLAVDSSGVTVVGSTSGVLPGQVKPSPYYSDSDAFVRRYDLDGNEIWTRQFGSATSDAATAVAADSSGIYVGGTGYASGQFVPCAYLFLRMYDVQGNAVWTRQFGSSCASESLGDVAVDSSGVMVVGSTSGAFPGQVKAGDYYDQDAFVSRYDLDGNETWTRQFGSATYDAAAGVAADGGAIYVAGTTYGALTGSGQGSSFISVDAFVRRYDLAGAEAWTRQFGGTRPGPDWIEAIDAEGNVYVAGTVTGALAGQTTSGYQDVFLRKYTREGVECWTRQFGTADYDEATLVSADSSGVTVAGAGSLGEYFVRRYDPSGNLLSTQGIPELSPGFYGWPVALDASGIYVAGITYDIFFGVDIGIFVRKYDPNGNELWLAEFGTADAYDYLAWPSPLAIDATGIYVTGQTSGTFPGEIGSGGYYDAFVAKLDQQGQLLWVRQFGSDGYDFPSGPAAGGGGVYVGGVVGSALPGQTSSGGSDVFLRRYDAAGNEVWTRQFGTSSSDWSYTLAADATGVYVGGSTGGSLAGQPNSGGWEDVFVRKYDAGGTELWTVQFGSPGNEEIYGIALDGQDVYVGGYVTGGVFPGQVGPAFPGTAWVARIAPPDSDGDGLVDAEELARGTNPYDPDTDDDGLLDGTEVDMAQGSGCPNPLVADSDGDTLPDGVEVGLRTSPCSTDTDSDQIPDNWDPDPLNPAATTAVLEIVTRTVATQMDAVPLTLFTGPNDNSNAGRRNSLSTRLRNAANALAAGNTAAAASLLTSVLQLMDGVGSPSDWVSDTPERANLAGIISQLIDLLS